MHIVGFEDVVGLRKLPERRGILGAKLKQQEADVPHLKLLAGHNSLNFTLGLVRELVELPAGHSTDRNSNSASKESFIFSWTSPSSFLAPITDNVAMVAPPWSYSSPILISPSDQLSQLNSSRNEARSTRPSSATVFN